MTQGRASLASTLTGLVGPYADNVIRLEIVRDGAVALATDHGCSGLAAFDEIFSADRVIEALTQSELAKFYRVKFGIRIHANPSIKGAEPKRTLVDLTSSYSGRGKLHPDRRIDRIVAAL